MQTQFVDIAEDLAAALDAVPGLRGALGAPLLELWLSSDPYQRRTLVLVTPDAGAAAGAEAPLAAALEVHRPTTVYAKLLPVWARSPEAEGALVAAVAQRAREAGLVGLKREFPARDDSWNRALASGFTELSTPGTGAPSLVDPATLPSGAVLWFGEGPERELPYYRQTTDMTCGAVSVGLALDTLGLAPALTRDSELQIWREANTTDGCDPLGLAMAANRRGADVEVFLSTEDAILLELARDEGNKDLRRFIQAGFREQVKEAGIPLHTRPFELAELDAGLERGKVGVVLIEELGMHAESCPHWIVLHSREGDTYYAQDPWTDADLSESWLDANALPIPRESLDTMTWYGQPRVRSMLLLDAPTASPTEATP